MRKYVLPIFMVILLAAIHLYISTSGISIQYENAKLKVEFNKLYQEMRNLKSEVSREEALGRVEKIAIGELKMEYPENLEYIVISEEGIKR